jgi:Mrp family chromosome partitioning ATPase
MSTFQQVLQKAKDEGKIDPGFLPWETSGKDQQANTPAGAPKLELPPQLTVFSRTTLNDLQKIVENMRTAAVSRSMQVIGLTSAVAGEGTSTLTSLLSLLMAAREKMAFEQTQQAQNNGKARKLGLLLIDTQVHHPSLHTKFSVDQRSGLIEYLETEIPFNRIYKRIENSSLVLITTGTMKNFHLTQDHLEKLNALLQVLKEKVNFIFLDLPALLPYAEGMSLGKLCDGVVLVVQAHTTRWEVIQEARRLLERSNVNILGGVLNRREFFIPGWVYRSI